jgi:hypothetical protein
MHTLPAGSSSEGLSESLSDELGTDTEWVGVESAAHLLARRPRRAGMACMLDPGVLARPVRRLDSAEAGSTRVAQWPCPTP